MLYLVHARGSWQLTPVSGCMSAELDLAASLSELTALSTLRLGLGGFKNKSIEGRLAQLRTLPPGLKHLTLVERCDSVEMLRDHDLAALSGTFCR